MRLNGISGPIGPDPRHVTPVSGAKMPEDLRKQAQDGGKGKQSGGKGGDRPPPSGRNPEPSDGSPEGNGGCLNYMLLGLPRILHRLFTKEQTDHPEAPARIHRPLSLEEARLQDIIGRIEAEITLLQLLKNKKITEEGVRRLRSGTALLGDNIIGKLARIGVTRNMVDACRNEPVSAREVLSSFINNEVIPEKEVTKLFGKFRTVQATEMLESLKKHGWSVDELA